MSRCSRNSFNSLSSCGDRQPALCSGRGCLGAQSQRLPICTSGGRTFSARLMIGASASSESRESLRLNPFRSFARMFLIEAMLHRQDMAQARAEFARLLTLNPDHRDSLESWYAEKQGKLSR